MPDRLAYTITEAARVSGVHPLSVDAAIKNGDLKTRRVGMRDIILAADLARWLESAAASNEVAK